MSSFNLWGSYLEITQLMMEPGYVSQKTWLEMHHLRTFLVVEDRDPIISYDEMCFRLCSIAAKVARSRKKRLPNQTHNMMILLGGKEVEAYIKMLKREKI